jgi:hypothetical protein
MRLLGRFHAEFLLGSQTCNEPVTVTVAFEGVRQDRVWSSGRGGELPLNQALERLREGQVSLPIHLLGAGLNQALPSSRTLREPPDGRGSNGAFMKAASLEPEETTPLDRLPPATGRESGPAQLNAAHLGPWHYVRNPQRKVERNPTAIGILARRQGTSSSSGGELASLVTRLGVNLEETALPSEKTLEQRGKILGCREELHPGHRCAG